MCHAAFCRLFRPLELTGAATRLAAMFVPLVAFALGVQLLNPPTAQAATRFWRNSAANTSWNNAANWSSVSAADVDPVNNGVPGLNDSVNVVFNDNVARTVTYDYTGTPVTLTGLTLDQTGGPQGSTTASTLSMLANNLTGGGLIVGDNGRGAFTQSGGTNNITANYLDLGFHATGSGTYTLSNAAVLSVVGHEYVGDAGTGDFTQTGGTNTISGAHDLYLGYAAGGLGTYTLGDSLTSTGNLSVGGNEYVGLSATGNFARSGGTFIQTGGINSIGNALNIGFNTNSTGIYTLFNSAALSTDSAFVGGLGTGTLTIQDQAVVSIVNNLSIGSLGIVNLNGGTLRFSNVSGLNQLHYTAGTIQLAGDRNFSSDATITAKFGTAPTIVSNKGLTVEGVTHLNALTTTVDGGKLTALSDLLIGTFASPNHLGIINAGTLTSVNAAIGYSVHDPGIPPITPPSERYFPATVTVAGAGSTWNNSGNLQLGSSDNNALGSGTLDISAGGTVNVGNLLLITNSSMVNLLGGTLHFSTISGLNRLNFSSGTIQLAGDHSIGSDTTISTLFGTIPTIPTAKGLIVDGAATLVAPLTIAGGTFKSNGLSIGTGGALDFDRGVLELTGGTITGLPSLVVPTGGEFRASGVQALRITGAAGSTITATGNLTLGNAAAVNGFYTDGTLSVGANSVTLNDANDAAFDTGSLVTVGNGASPGTVNAANGLTLDFGGNVTGFGTLSTPNNLAKPLINNGHISGNSAAQPITLSGYVKGVGTFSNVNFTGTFSPGLSPTIISVENIALSPTSTLIMEIGGTAPGSGYDQIQSSGTLALDGVLQVSLINGFTPTAGQTFDLFNGTSVVGTFSSVQLPALAGLSWNAAQLAAGILRLQITGDYNGNGIVDAADYTVWRDTLGSTTDLRANGDNSGTSAGKIDQADYAFWKTNFGTHAGGAAEANAAVPEPAPLFLLLLGGFLLQFAKLRR